MLQIFSSPLLVLSAFLTCNDYYYFSGDIKRICETELGLMSQCCLAKHVFKICKRYLANVSLKINVKVVISWEHWSSFHT